MGRRLSLAAALCAALGIATASAERGFRVVVRANEKPGAPPTGEVQLYRTSHALVVGIDAYGSGWPRLSNAIRDARDVAEALKANGFEVELKTDLDSMALERALKEFFVIKGLYIFEIPRILEIIVTITGLLTFRPPGCIKLLFPYNERSIREKCHTAAMVCVHM